MHYSGNHSIMICNTTKRAKRPEQRAEAGTEREKSFCFRARFRSVKNTADAKLVKNLAKYCEASKR